jgi:hypothetical protein
MGRRNILHRSISPTFTLVGIRDADSWYVGDGALVVTGGTRKIERVEDKGVS